MEHSQYTQADVKEIEIDFFDLLVIVLDKLHWIAASVGVVSVLTLGILMLVPSTYQSSSIIATEKTSNVPETILGLSPHHVASILKSTDLALQFYKAEPKLRDLDEEKALEKINKLINVSVGRQDKLVTLMTEGDSPESAQALNTFLLERMFDQAKPRGLQLESINKDIKVLNDAMSNSTQILSQLNKLTANGRDLSDAQANVLSSVMRELPALSTKLTLIESVKAGLSSSDLVQTPTLPRKPSGPRKLRAFVVSLLASGFLAFIFIIAHYHWCHGGRDKYLAKKKTLTLSGNS